MARGLRLDVLGDRQLRKAIRRLGPRFNDAVRRANNFSGKAIVAGARRNLRENGTNNFGLLSNALRVRLSRDGLTAEVGVPEDEETTHPQLGRVRVGRYGPFVERGTRPHFPPIKPIQLWAKRKLGDPGAAYPIAKKIAEQGTRPQPFFEPAVAKETRRYKGRLEDELAEETRHAGR